MILKVISWNIWHGKYLEKIIKFLAEQKPDVIALQEVNESEKLENIAKQIADRLNYNFVFCNAFETDRHDDKYKMGNAILTKFKITKSKCHFLSSVDLYKGDAETEPRVALEVFLKAGDQNFRIITVHLAYSYRFKNSKMRNLQVENLLKLLPGEKTILMGDFNSHPDGEAVQKINAVMMNADRELNQPTLTVYPFDYKGFVETKLTHRIDYIFTSPDVRVQSFKVEESDGSDHLPISAVLEI